MISDVGTMVWKEAKEILSLSGGRTKWGLLIFVGLFGVLMPLQMGKEWVESPMALAYWAWIPLLLVNATIADAFAGERERHTLETLLASRLSDRVILLGKACAAIGYGCAITWASVLMGLVTVNLAHGHGELLLYPAGVSLGIAVLSILTAGLGAGAGILISLRAPTVRQAQQTLSRVIILLIFVPVFGAQALPDAWKLQLVDALSWFTLPRAVIVASAVLIVSDAAFLAAALARFRRTRLILE
jgi:ABC-2 type transport system permease protein